ncbi:hypothetical protein GCM10027290_48910 [Micromonospora sonneratiae]|uniref:Right handed beta helix region n=1 Tax=Micromonospora sonneratiae TaxID=1184706 RepID=A0ABW3YN82_9ACTN
MTISWKNGSSLPMARPRYYDHQYLRASDLSQAMDYLLSRQNLIARLLQPVGVVKGLEITPIGSDITIGEGVAIDTDGAVIVLPEARRVGLPADGTFFVTLRYREWLTDSRNEGGVAAETRWSEEGQVEVTPGRPADPGRVVVLGRVTRSQGVVTVDSADRVAAGLRVPVGAIVPAIGDNRQAGIQFPSDPGGGSGDEAFIRYVVRHDENTALRIGVGNDPDDMIDFYQSGASRLRIAQSMLNIGSLDGATVVADEVAASIAFWGPGVQHAQLSFRPGRGFELVDQSNNWPSSNYALDSRPYADLGIRDLRANTVRGRGSLSVTTDGVMGVRAQSGLHVIKDVGADGNLTVQGNATVEGNIHLGANKSITTGGRLNVDGGERLHLLNRSGVYIGHGGTTGSDVGCLWVEKRASVGGNLGVAGVNPSGLPTAGIGTWDLYARGGVYVGPESAPAIKMLNTGVLEVRKIVYTTQSAVMDHPLNKAGESDPRKLVYSPLGGPENGVYFRGEGRLVDGVATVELPEYFEALTLLEGRTVQLTPMFEDDEPVSPLAASRVAAGEFRVRTVDGVKASHGFYWQVFAVRADVEPLEPEVSTAAWQASLQADPTDVGFGSEASVELRV